MLHPISDRIDKFVDWLKWPVAIAAVLLLVPSLLSCFDLVIVCVQKPETILPFIGGAGLYLLVWLWTIRRWRATLLSTFEHEFTHALFAILTLHRVTELKATWKSGGHVRIIGLGNWLITVAPYFFPTVCFLLIPLFRLLTFIPTHFADAIVGAAFVYHITSTMRETHSGQTDLQQVGYLFSVMFLPTAVLVSHGMVLAFAWGDWKGIHVFLSTIGLHLQSMATFVGLA
ncbi:MAG: M50 family metallopeptidase [Planctomycetales bacterium]|jgi:hypothetical protein